MSDVLRLVAISGSLREGSYNTALLQNVRELMPPTMRMTIHSIADVPLFNEDVEVAGTPAAVSALHRAMRTSDGVIIATPEYNHGIPGVLKNTLDWLSRGAPHGFYGIPSALLGASNGMIGTTRSQAATRQTLAALNSPCLPQPQVLVSLVHQKIDASGRLTDESTRAFIRTWLVEVERWMRRFPRHEREDAGS
jgi:chromate reductase